MLSNVVRRKSSQFLVLPDMVMATEDALNNKVEPMTVQGRRESLTVPVSVADSSEKEL